MAPKSKKISKQKNDMLQQLRLPREKLKLIHKKLKTGITEEELWSHFHKVNIENGGEWLETRLLTSGHRTNPWLQECSNKIIEKGDKYFTKLDIDKETVNYRPNYDDRLEEPTVLPSGFPNMLCNGAVGIATTMATAIPPHNLREIVDGLTALIDDPELDVDGLMAYIKAPDFPTGGIIYGLSGVLDAYRTGRGHIYIRAKASVEEDTGGRETIIITEIPYMVNKTTLLEKMADLVFDLE